MEPEQHEQETHTRWQSSVAKEYAVPVAIVIAGFMLAVSYYQVQTGSRYAVRSAPQSAISAQLEESVIPSKGVELPVIWGDLGKRMVELGAIDADKMAALYQNRGGFPAENEKLLLQGGNGKLMM